MQKLTQLGFRVRQAMPKRRSIGARPNSAPRRNDNDDSSFWRHDAPNFLEKRLRSLGSLQSVRHQQTIDRAVRQWQHLRVYKRGRAVSWLWPNHHAVFRRHHSNATPSFLTKSVQKWCSIPDRRDGKSVRIFPTRAYHATDQST